MRVTLLIILFSCQSVLLAQGQNTYSLRWKVADSIIYKVAFDQVEVKDENIDKSDTTSMKYKMRQLLETIKESVKDYKLESSIKKNGQLYNVVFYFGGHPIVNGDINDSGDLLTKAEGTSGNFFKLFYDLPDHEIKVGDKWPSNLKMKKKFRGITFTDSTKKDEIIFKDFKVVDGDSLATLKFEFTEKYSGHYKDEQGVTQPANFEFTLDNESIFNISDGKWSRMEGLAIFEYRIPKITRGVMKIGMVEKE